MARLLNKIILCCFIILLSKLTNSTTRLKDKKSAYAFKTFLDLNGDGELNVTDFDQLAGYFIKLKGFEINGKEHTALKEYVHSIFNGLLEQSGAQKVAYVKMEQWIKMWEVYSANSTTVPVWQQNYINLVFGWMDKNDDGLISRNEFVSFMVIHGKNGTDAGICFDKFSEGKGPVDKKKFLELWNQYFTSDDPTAPGNFLAGKPNINTE